MRINDKGNAILRGRAIEADGPKKINLYSGTYTKGFRLVNFQIASHGFFISEECQGVLTTTGEAFANLWNWEDQTQVGWASTDMVAGGTRQSVFSLVDSSMILVDAIYVNVNNNKGPNDPTNYLIELEPVDLHKFEWAMNYIQNQSQG